MKLEVILSLIDLGSLNLPQFQRGYVWNRTQVRKLMRSLYYDYPVGGLLIWETQAGAGVMRASGQSAASSQKLLLDGQQRITSLYGIIRGHTPRFYDGANPPPFLNLYFNVATEEFEFYGPVKMKDDPTWVSVTELMQEGVWHIAGQFQNHPDGKLYGDRLYALEKIKGSRYPGTNGHRRGQDNRCGSRHLQRSQQRWNEIIQRRLGASEDRRTMVGCAR